MDGILAKKLNNSNAISNANRYAEGLIRTDRKKTCTEIAKVTERSHDAVQRDLNTIAKHPEEIKTLLISDAIKQNQKNPGYCIVDTTTLVKKHSQKIEGVSRQYCGSELSEGVSVTTTIWTNLDCIIPVGLFTWKKGDQPKTKTAIGQAIVLNQKIGAKGMIADAAFASVENLTLLTETNTSFVMRFHSNRVVSVQGFPPTALKKHPAFKFVRNEHCIIRRATWHNIEVCIVALRIKTKHGDWKYIYLVTNNSLRKAREYAELYKRRWCIEVFFRTCKQTFGLSDCQARSLKQQEAHCLSVFLAYHYIQTKQYAYQNKQLNSSFCPMDHKIAYH